MKTISIEESVEGGNNFLHRLNFSYTANVKGSIIHFYEFRSICKPP